MIGEGTDATLLQLVSEVIHVASPNAADDAALAGVPLDDLQRLIQLVSPRDHPINQVGPVEVADQNRGILETQLGGDVPANLLGGGRRVSMDGGAREEILQPAELPVFGTKVVTPVTDAVRFIDGEGAHTNVVQQLLKSGNGQPLRRYEQQSDLAIDERVLGDLPFGSGHGAVDLEGGNAERGESVDLILHEGDEGHREPPDSVREAMGWYEKAEAMRPSGNDDALLRWNTCARIFQHNPDLHPREEERMEPLLE